MNVKPVVGEYYLWRSMTVVWLGNNALSPYDRRSAKYTGIDPIELEELPRERLTAIKSAQEKKHRARQLREAYTRTSVLFVRMPHELKEKLAAYCTKNSKKLNEAACEAIRCLLE